MQLVPATLPVHTHVGCLHPRFMNAWSALPFGGKCPLQLVVREIECKYVIIEVRQTQLRRRLCCHVCMMLHHNMIFYSTGIYYTDAVGSVAPLFNEELNCMRAWQPDVQAVSHGVPYQPRL